jgi:RNA polymerase sigma factor (sigma-70 family)
MSGDYQGHNNQVDALVVSNLRLAYAMAKRRSPFYLREDAAQEGAIKLWQAAQNYAPERGSFSSYASTCIGRRIMDFTKIERRRGAHFEPFDSFEHDCKYGPTSLDRVISSEDRSNISELCKAVQSLPLYERHVITFRFGLYEEEPRTLVEIGKMLKVPKEKVRSIQNRALKKLKEILAQD